MSGQHAAALEHARRAAAQAPGDGEAQRVLADLLALTGAVAQANYYYERAIKAAPQSAATRSNFGWHLYRQGELDRAAAVLEEAMRIDPAYPGSYRNLVFVLQARRETLRAVEVGRAGLARFPADDVLARNLAIALMGAGLADEAAGVLRSVRERRPVTLPLQTLLALVMNYCDSATPEAVFEEHRALGQLFSAAFPNAAVRHENAPDPERPLRIGYLSPAFCNHSAGHFIQPILEHHDRARYLAYCYAAVRQEDEMTRAMRAAAAGWTDVNGLGPSALAAKIRADAIDIAVDLTGHTSDSMLGALCLRPAPVQAMYLGYPNTTGLPAIGYRLIDARTDPPGAERLATEALVRLDPCFLCYMPPPGAPEPAPEPPCVASGHVTFGSFNTNPKLSGATLDLWARVLRENPGSRLLLKNQDLNDASIVELRRRQFAERGVEPERVDLMGETPTKAEHLGMYARVDIALDPFPYNGTTTTVEALFMGVPVVALEGASHVSRVSVSLLSVVGLEELIARNADEYARIARELASDAGRLAELRRTLRGRVLGSALCDGRAFTRTLEAAYRAMWRAWCEGQKK